MVKSEPKKKPQSGGFFQKFFRKSEKSQKEQRLTVQRSIPYLEMGRDGICRVEEHLYSKTVRFYDINYQLAQNEDKNTIFESWCDFLNYFDGQIYYRENSFMNKVELPAVTAERVLGMIALRETTRKLLDCQLHDGSDAEVQLLQNELKQQWNYSMEVGKDPQGNILRVTNALAGIERALPQVERRLETLEQQLTQAKEEAKRPFAQEAELAEKSARLAELNSLLNMDEKGSEDALGVDEDAAETEVADKPRQPVNYAGRVAERTADNVRKPSVLEQLHAKQAERSAEPQKSQKRKSHDMEL